MSGPPVPDLRPERDAYRISADVGGTFTDVVVAAGDGRLALGKALTDHDHAFGGVRRALDVAAAALGADASAVLARASTFVYASTRALNAIIEGRTARTALLVTRGFPDVLVLREGGRLDPFDFTRPSPDPYVPRSLTFEIPERVDAEGQVVAPLDEAAAILVIRQLAELEVEAVAVCLLWSVANPVHERRLGELIRAHLPGVPYTLSHEIAPVVREYRRASSAAIDASLKPLMRRHLGGLASELREAGFRGAAYAATSAGGLASIETLESAPVDAIRSGPSMAPLAARSLATGEGLGEDLIVCDAGGTSFDLSLVRAGRIAVSREAWLGAPYEGHATGLAAVDVRSVGAGGGSIAWRDAGGMLRVGPHSAGSEPGPACYGRGGTEPTVTDAAVVLGYLDPAHFLGGRMPIDADAARAAVGRLGRALGLDAVEAAAGILRVASEQMLRAIVDLTVGEGLDPRDCVIVAGGGAAGLNIVQVAAEIGVRRVLVPRVATALSAYGAQQADVEASFESARRALTSSLDLAAVNDELAAVEARARGFAAELHAAGIARTAIRYSVDARYPGQVWELPIDLDGARLEDASQVRALEARFHQAHAAVFGASQPDQPVEFTQWAAHVTGSLPRPAIGPLGGRAAGPPDADGPPASLPARQCAFAPGGWRPTPVVSAERLTPGAELVGPAIIEDAGTTIVLYPGSRAVASPLGNLLVTIESSAGELSPLAASSYV